MNFSGIFGSFKCVEGDEKCTCNLQNEGSSERSRASPKREDSPEDCEEAWKKAKACSPGSGDVR